MRRPWDSDPEEAGRWPRAVRNLAIVVVMATFWVLTYRLALAVLYGH